MNIFAQQKAMLAAALLCLAPAASAYTEPINGYNLVTNTNDSGPGSLREALQNADPGGEVVIDNSVSPRVFTLSSGPIKIDTRISVDFGGITIISTGPAIEFECGSEGTVLTGVRIQLSHSSSPSVSIISSCPSIRSVTVQNQVTAGPI